MHKIVLNISNKWIFLFYSPCHTINITYFIYKYSEIVLDVVWGLSPQLDVSDCRGDYRWCFLFVIRMFYC